MKKLKKDRDFEHYWGMMWDLY